MKGKNFIHIILFVLLSVMVVGVSAQNPAQPAKSRPKTLKELVAEEKAQKAAEKKAREEEAARLAEEKKRQDEEKKRKAEERAQRQKAIDEGGDIVTPESVADWTTNTDSVLWAPTRVKQLGAQNYGELTSPVSSLDLQDPENVTTSVEYQPETGTYVIRTKMGNTEISTPYMLTQEEYNQ